jgi:predicted nucleic acid-binding protein
VILLDSNVLIYSLDPKSKHGAASRAVVTAALHGKFEAVLVPQILLEFYSVVTSARRVASPISPGAALDQIEDFTSAIPLREATARCLVEWLRMSRQAGRAGSATYDLYLIAQMRVHGVEEVCTQNVDDFMAEGVGAITPDDLARRIGA